MPSEVLVLLTNYSRPQNMPSVIRAWREQTVPVKIVVVDNRPDLGNVENPYETYPNHGWNENLDDKDFLTFDTWRWTENLGCPCWIPPAIGLSHRHKYIIRADDDFLPGSQAVEWLLWNAATVGDEFSTIGQIGRLFSVRTTYDQENQKESQEVRYNRYNVPRTKELVKVDLTCRVSMMRGDLVSLVPVYRDGLIGLEPGWAKNLIDVHDDFLLCMGLQTYTGHPSYVIPLGPDPETELVKTEIKNGPESVYKRPGHYNERESFVALAVRAGWKTKTDPA